MKSSLTISVRVDVKQLATLIRAAIVGKVFSRASPKGVLSNPSIANAMRLALQAAVAPHKNSSVEFTSDAKAWQYLESLGITQQRASRSEPTTIPAASLADARLLLLEQNDPEIVVDMNDEAVLKSLQTKEIDE